MGNIRISLAIIFLFLVCNVHSQDIPSLKAGESVPKDIQRTAAINQRSRTYANTLDGVNQVNYEFMITETGSVIYKEGTSEEWKYFGDKGYSLDTTDFDNDYKSIGPVDMIAACGNRVFVKTKNSNLFYFALIVDGNIDLTKNDGSNLNSDTPHGCSFFITSAPDDYRIYNNYDNYVSKHILKDVKQGPCINSGIALLLPLTPKKALSIIGLPYIDGNYNNTLPLIPYSWPVVTEKRIWYRLKADNLNALKIIDIGVSEINKIEASRYAYIKKIDRYLKTFGGEFWSKYQQPICNLFGLFIDTASNSYLLGDNRNYGSLTDGIANYYVLTEDKKKNYRVWYIDEQAFFCSQWYKFAEYLERALNDLKYPGIIYHNLNWTKYNWDYRGGAKGLATIGLSFINANLGNKIYNQAWKFADSNFELGEFYKPNFAEVGPYPSDPWVWTAFERVYQPDAKKHIIGLSEDCNLKPFFNHGQWTTISSFLSYYHQLQRPFESISPYWGALPPMEEEPSMEVSKVGNIALCTSDKIYTINWAWGSLDFTWRVRPKHRYSIGTRIIFQYEDTVPPNILQSKTDEKNRLSILVPGHNGYGVWGYYRQDYLPKNFLDDDNIRPTFNYIDKKKASDDLPPFSDKKEKWDWIPFNNQFTNSDYDFPRSVPFKK